MYPLERAVVRSRGEKVSCLRCAVPHEQNSLDPGVAVLACTVVTESAEAKSSVQEVVVSMARRVCKQRTLWEDAKAVPSAGPAPPTTPSRRVVCLGWT